MNKIKNQQSTGEIAACSAYTNETAFVCIPRQSRTAGPSKDCYTAPAMSLLQSRHAEIK